MKLKRSVALGCLAVGSLLVPLDSLQAQNGSKPNIVFMMADNLGYGDVGIYGGGELRGAPTPRIDQLAAEGPRLTNSSLNRAARRPAPQR